jgi:hypothetical protein
VYYFNLSMCITVNAYRHACFKSVFVIRIYHLDEINCNHFFILIMASSSLQAASKQKLQHASCAALRREMSVPQCALKVSQPKPQTHATALHDQFSSVCRHVEKHLSGEPTSLTGHPL